MARANPGNFYAGWGIVLALIPLVVLNVSHGGQASGQALPATSSQTQAEALTEGAPFTIGHLGVLPGWRVAKGKGGRFGIDHIAAKNADPVGLGHQRRAFFTISLLSQTVVAATISCDTGPVRPGQVEVVDCVDIGPHDHSGNFDAISVAPSF